VRKLETVLTVEIRVGRVDDLVADDARQPAPGWVTTVKTCVSPTSGSVTAGVTGALAASSVAKMLRSATEGRSLTARTVTEAVPTTLRLVESVARNVKLSGPL